MKLVIEVDEVSEGMYELLDSVRNAIKNNAPATLSPVHVKSMRIME